MYACHTKQTNWPRERHYETGDSPAATLSHWGQASSRKQSECGRHGLSNILKLQATFLYSFYHQRAGKTNLFHMIGGRFHAGITLLTFDKFHEFPWQNKTVLIFVDSQAWWNEQKVGGWGKFEEIWGKTQKTQNQFRPSQVNWIFYPSEAQLVYSNICKWGWGRFLQGTWWGEFLKGGGILYRSEPLQQRGGRAYAFLVASEKVVGLSLPPLCDVGVEGVVVVPPQYVVFAKRYWIFLA